jgi:Na+/H+-translocating membrane pyrophosphatase
MVKDNLPDNIIYQGNLKIDNVYSSKNITTGAVNIGDLSSGQTKTITFEAKVESKDKFNYGTTDLINTGLAYNTETSVTDTCKVIVKKTAVAGAATSISTGISNGILNSILLPLIITLAIVWIFRSKLIGFDEWSEKKKKETEEYRANKLLKKKIAQLRTQGIV